MERAPVTQASLSTRLSVWFSSIPVTTRAVLVTCSGIYIVSALVGFDDLGAVCLAPAPVLRQWQAYRLLTAALFHVSALHLAMNMLAFVPVAASLERQQGSVPLAWLLALLAALGGCAYLAFATLATAGPQLPPPLDAGRQCAVGLSGVIFGLLPIDTAASGAAHRSIFGLASVPARLYPWLLLLVWQLLVPGSSFLGHLCGLLAGQLYAWGCLRWALLPPSAVQRAERLLCQACYHRPGFISAAAGAGGDGEAVSSLLPLVQRPGAAPASPTARAGSGWLRGSWMPFPQERSPFQPPPPPRGVRLGGAPGGGGTAAQQQQQQQQLQPADPKAAAAAAAEARAAKAMLAGSSMASGGS